MTRKAPSAPHPPGTVEFSAPLLEGHKGAAVEVPFDPAERWGQAPRALRAGRRGHWARGDLDGVPFTSEIVPRSGRFWLLVDEALRRAAGAKIGGTVRVSIERPAPDAD